MTRLAIAFSALALLLGAPSTASAHPHVAKACPGIVHGIYYYRDATRSWEHKLGRTPTKSSFNASIVRSCKYATWVAHTWQHRAQHVRKEYQAWWHALNADPVVAICSVFGSYCSQAKTVAWCEGKYSPDAKNGQYLGTFQMGDYERATYGHGSTVLEQARAAYRYFVASGKDWSPWECKP